MLFHHNEKITIQVQHQKEKIKKETICMRKTNKYFNYRTPKPIKKIVSTTPKKKEN